ncbi:hypothetical protein C1645_827307 [Glomus cerebriforme]|uniref:Anaphase-promoting complex subunit 4 WD40 domain-containing protein n=1 Tax=Glomus cerebriforme TaxID=658196 RepID=A0A397SNJ8_9GLOM|nr:hypothetical protein C1645_827307 [Glomus cerebriforme]
MKVNSGHKAAICAISWSPHFRNLLVSGGGHLDYQIFLVYHMSGIINDLK